MKEQRLSDVLQALKKKCLFPTVGNVNGSQEWESATHRYVANENNELFVFRGLDSDFECIQALSGHSDAVQSVAFSPDGKRIASGSYDNTVKVWQDGQCIQTLSGHSSYVNGVAFSPDGKRIASASSDSTVKVWEDGQCIQTLSGHSSYVNGVAFSPDGKRIASASDDNTVKVWQDGQCIQTLSGHSDSVNGVAFSPDDKRIASASDDCTVKVWQDGQCIQTLSGHSDSVNRVAFSPDGKRIASASDDKTVKVWQNGQCIQTLSGHSDTVFGVAFSPDGKRIVSGSDDKTVKVWQDGQCIKTLTGHSERVWDVAFSPDGKRIASASSDQTVKLWQDGKCIQTLSGHTAAVIGVAFSPDGKRIASGSIDNTVKVWSLPEKLQYKITSPSPAIALAVSDDSDHFATVHENGELNIWQRDQCVNTVNLNLPDVQWMSFYTDSIIMGEQANGKAFIIENGQLVWNDVAKGKTFTESTLLAIKSDSDTQCVFGEGASSVRDVETTFRQLVKKEQEALTNLQKTAQSKVAEAEANVHRLAENERETLANLEKTVQSKVAEAEALSKSLRSYISSLESTIDRLRFDLEFSVSKLDTRGSAETIQASLSSLHESQEASLKELKQSLKPIAVDQTFSVDSLQVSEMLAYGGQGVVHQCVVESRDAAFKEPVFRPIVKANGSVIPGLEPRRQAAFESLRNEYEALRALSSPNVVHPIGLVVQPGTNDVAGVLLQLCPLGDLSTFSKRLLEEDKRSESVLFRIALQVALGLSAVRSAGFVHRDVKACNFLVCRDENGKEIVKVGDLGTADFSEYNQKHTIPIGVTGEFRPTSRYASPEYFGSKTVRMKYQQSVSHDLWGYGHVLYECATGKTPFYEEEDDRDAEHRVRDGDKPTWPSDSNVPEWLKTLCGKCWTTSAEERLAAFPQEFQTIVLDLCRLNPEEAKSLLVDLARFERAEMRNMYVTADVR
eukprot:ANDGO_01312.mRNA.1 Vegetative incompatibility protein HET-E-1